jgi:hypothetical protein
MGLLLTFQLTFQSEVYKYYIHIQVTQDRIQLCPLCVRVHKNNFNSIIMTNKLTWIKYELIMTHSQSMVTNSTYKLEIYPHVMVMDMA